MAATVLLIVLDDPGHRIFFNQLLKSSPHRLIFANDGEDGFDRYSEAKPDVVIAHVNAPKIDGTILCQLIRKQAASSSAKTPVILFGEELANSALARARVKAVGASGYFAVPLDRAEVFEALRPYVPGLPSSNRPTKPRPESAEDATELEIEPLATDFEITLDEEEDVAADLRMDPALEAAAKAEDGAFPTHPFGLIPAEAPKTDDIPRKLSFADETVEHRAPGSEMETSPLPLPIPPAPVEDIDVLEEPVAPTAARKRGRDRAELFLPRESSGSDREIIPVIHLGASGDIFSLTPSGPGGGVRAPQPITEPDSYQGDLSLLEEPPLPGASASGALRPGTITKSDVSPISAIGDRLIREVPRDATPTGGAPQHAAGGEGDEGAQRRGLDESQLGKRLVKRVRSFFRLLDELDYYQLLGVERTATDPELRTAYFELSLEFHPDRFFLLRSGDLKEKIYAVYRRIGEAYAVLADPRRRAAFDQALVERHQKRAPPDHRATKRSDPAPRDPSGAGVLDVEVESEAAQRYVVLSRAALEQADIPGARMFIAFAVGLEPASEDLRRASLALAELQKRKLASGADAEFI